MYLQTSSQFYEYTCIYCICIYIIRTLLIYRICSQSLGKMPKMQLLTFNCACAFPLILSCSWYSRHGQWYALVSCWITRTCTTIVLLNLGKRDESLHKGQHHNKDNTNFHKYSCLSFSIASIDTHSLTLGTIGKKPWLLCTPKCLWQQNHTFSWWRIIHHIYGTDLLILMTG